MAWDVVDLDGWELWQQETEGDNEKQWFVEPMTGERWLFKPNRQDRSPFESHAEVIASRVADLLELPAAHAELAERRGALGCISKNVFSHGASEEIRPDQILAGMVEDYDHKAKVRIGHNRANVVVILKQCQAPKSVSETHALSAVDWFVVYLFFDALIGNVDRHSSNWALELDWSSPDSNRIPLRLAPSFDHASSLGVSVRDRGLERISARTDGFFTYPFKATAGRFEDGVNVSLVDYAASYLQHCSDDGRRFLKAHFLRPPLDDFVSIIDSANLSPVSTKLATTIITTNSERIAQCLSQH